MWVVVCLGWICYSVIVLCVRYGLCLCDCVSDCFDFCCGVCGLFCWVIVICAFELVVWVLLCIYFPVVVT